MAEGFDAYTDQFQFQVTPYGVVVDFRLTSPMPPAPGTIPAAERLGSVRMSLELAMLLAYMLQKALRDQRARAPVDLPVEVLNGAGIALEDWQRFWAG